MMPSDTDRLLSRFNGNPPADPDALARFASETKVVLPEDYVRFLRRANGGEGFIGPNA
jgi:hypothetical protein